MLHSYAAQLSTFPHYKAWPPKCDAPKVMLQKLKLTSSFCHRLDNAVLDFIAARTNQHIFSACLMDWQTRAQPPQLI